MEPLSTPVPGLPQVKPPPSTSFPVPGPTQSTAGLAADNYKPPVLVPPPPNALRTPISKPPQDSFSFYRPFKIEETTTTTINKSSTAVTTTTSRSTGKKTTRAGIAHQKWGSLKNWSLILFEKILKGSLCTFKKIFYTHFLHTINLQICSTLAQVNLSLHFCFVHSPPFSLFPSLPPPPLQSLAFCTESGKREEREKERGKSGE